MTHRIDTSILCMILRYEPETGNLFWLNRTPSMFPQRSRDRKITCKSFNSQFAGKQAFTASSHGYRVGAVFDQLYPAHHVAWAIYHGSWPDMEVDHINHDRGDNRIVNLRLVTHEENHRNLPLRTTNKSGTPGVQFCEKPAKWRANITVSANTMYLGSFDRKRDAVRVRKSAERKYGFHANCGNRAVATAQGIEVKEV